MTRQLYAQENPRSPLNRKVGVPQNRCGRFGADKGIFPLPVFEPRNVKARSLVTVLTTVPQFPLFDAT
jgi:hypothetical protein